VRECFKGDEASKWKRPKFDPSPHQNPLTGLHKKIGRRDYILDSTRRAKLRSDRFRGFCSPNMWFCRAIWSFDVTSFYVRFWVFSLRLQPTPLNVFLRKMRQITSFQVRKFLLGVPITIFDIYALKFPKNRHFRDRFWLDSFFAAENRFNMGDASI